MAVTRSSKRDGNYGETMLQDKVHWSHILFLRVARPPSTSGWQPPADVYRTPTGWFIKLELAGVRPDEVHLAVRGQTLLVEGTRRDESSRQNMDCHVMEITYCRFERVLTLPGLSNRAEVAASHRDGMLLVEIMTEGRP
jgi:HSP20 family protein